jgi:hypothetical protein
MAHTQKRYVSLHLTFCWLEPTHMVTANCEGVLGNVVLDWEATSSYKSILCDQG